MRTFLTRAGLAVAVAAALALASLTPARPARATAGPAPEAPTRIDFLDVGQGDSILIRTPEGKTALIDAGPSSKVVETLKQRGVTQIDLVAVTHHHSDHYGGMRAVLKAYHPTYFLATDSSHTTASYLKLLEMVRDEGITALRPTSKRRRIELGSVVLTVFPQPPETTNEENNNSIGIRLDDGDVSVLMTGDSEETERQWWLSHCPGLLRDANILKLAHHGSRNGTDARWLNLVRPELTVASLGTGNDYGHPHPETVSLLARQHIPFKRTDQDGTIAVETDGRTWRLVPTELARDTGSKSRPKNWKASSRTASHEPAAARR